MFVSMTPGSCARPRLGFSPGLPRRRNLGVDLIHGKLVHTGLLSARPRLAKPFRRQILFQDLQSVLLGQTPRAVALAFSAGTFSSGSSIVRFRPLLQVSAAASIAKGPRWCLASLMDNEPQH